MGGDEPRRPQDPCGTRRLDDAPPARPRSAASRRHLRRPGAGKRGARGSRGHHRGLRAGPDEGMKRRIAILFGGRSAEHGVSCVSARAVIDALDRDRYEPIPIGITIEGRWQLMSEPPALGPAATELPSVSDTSGTAVELAGEGDDAAVVTEGGRRTGLDIGL